MTLEVLIPAGLKVSPDVKGWPRFTPSSELVKLVNSQPQQVGTAKGEPVDVTNVMLIGPREKVEAVFREAGWADAISLGARSGLKTFTAIVFKQGYDQAPFSNL